MELDPDKLDAILGILLDRGVEEFECPSFHVKFGYGGSATTTTVTETVEGIPERKSMFEDKRLWQGNPVPTFPKADR